MLFDQIIPMRYLFFLLFFPVVAYTQNFSGGYSFALPPYDSSAQLFLPEFPAKIIGESERVIVEGAQFMSGGVPIRFWGVNITAAAAFPPKAQAAAIAARMRKMGINLVRFHHLENSWTGDNGCIFVYAQGTRSLNPVTLDRLDYFIAQLKKNGIYVNMNLNVSRLFKESDGVAGADSLVDFAKGSTLFDPYLQFLQKEYAEQLLGHVNPYTGTSLATDPVLAMVEMNNENSLYGYWKEEKLKPFAQGGVLLWDQSRWLDVQWQNWLKDKYGTDDNLKAAWNMGVVPPGAGELLQNPGFEAGAVNTGWSLELHDVAQANQTTVTTSPHSGARCARLQVTQVSGTDWHIQFKQSGFSLKKDSAYTVKIYGRASAPKDFSVSVMRDNAPYTWYAGASFVAGTQWQEFKFSFVATEDNMGFGRLSISPLNNVATFYFDDASIALSSIAGLLPGELLDAENIARMDFKDRNTFTERRVADMAAYYQFLQKKHFDELGAFLKNDLQIKAALTGTNALVGPADASLHEDLDYLDDHSYWDHPSFPGIPWDPYNWLISNQPMVRTPEFGAIINAFSGLAYTGKPFTVSEYNHAMPNRFRTEMPHAVLAYGAFHGMDGVMFFDYNSGYDWTTDVVDNHFSIHHDHSIMALFPSCAYAFRHGLIQEENNPIVVSYSQDAVNALAKTDDQGRWGHYLPYDLKLQLTNSIRTSSYESAQTSNFNELPAPGSSPYTTSTNETILDTGKGLLRSATNRFVAISGFLQAGTGTEVGALRLIGSDDFGSLTWLSLGDAPLNQASRSLLTLTSKQQNSNMVWDGTTTLHIEWGDNPTKQDALLVSLSLSIQADSIQIYPLNIEGKEQVSQTYFPGADGRFQVVLDQNQKQSMWFGVAAYGGQVLGTAAPQADVSMRVFPNPMDAKEFTLDLNGSYTGPCSISIADLQGKNREVLYDGICFGGAHQFRLNIPDLPSGIYLLEVDLGKMGKKFVKLVMP